MAGTLYLVATPIGNLEDMTYRAVRVLMEADLIACEDTRTSSHLLNAYEIHTPLISYHKFNERDRSKDLIDRLLKGTNIALITDAGMPAISDPGEILVRECHENNIKVTAVPGASASVTALALSGLDTRRFVFEGFLPADNKERRELLDGLSEETRTMIFYEAPHRLQKTLGELTEVFGADRPVTLCREITKKFEEISPVTLAEAVNEAAKDTPRGEYVLVVAGMTASEIARRRASRWETTPVAEHVAYYEAQGMSRKEAMKAAAKDRGVSKRDIYSALL